MSEIAIRQSGPLAQFWQEFSRSKLAIFGLISTLVLMLLAAFAPVVSPQDPYDLAQISFFDGELPPFSTGTDGDFYLLGTDAQGRDMLSAVIYGLRASFTVALSAGALAFLAGTTLGLVAAYFRGGVDAIIMRIAEIQMSFPTILIALVLLAIFGRGLDKTILALALVQWAYYARTVRGAAVVERSKEYIQACRLLRLPSWRVLFLHLLPNVCPPLLVIAGVQLASAITLEATLSFLGLGLPVTEPSLGLLISNGFDYLLSGKTWISFYPGIALLFVIVSINLLADRLREMTNPRLRK